MNEIHTACGKHLEESVRSSVFAFVSMRGTLPCEMMLCEWLDEIASKTSSLIHRSYRWYWKE